MPKEHDELIAQAKAAPDIETALEGTFMSLASKWRDVATRNDFGKGAAMSAHMTSDVDLLVTAILDHSKVFKGEPVKPPPSRASTLPGTPKTAEKPQPVDETVVVTPKTSIFPSMTPHTVVEHPIVGASDGPKV